MKKNTRFIVIGVGVVLIILLGLPLVGLPFIYSTNTDVDINSGDIRQRTVLYTFVIKEKIEQTPFSKEVRRLGIPIEENRKWEHGFTSTPTMHGSSRYWSSCRRCMTIVAIFGDINMPDDERTEILQRVFTYLQTGNHEELQDQYSAMLKKQRPVGPPPNQINIEDTNEF